MKKLVIASVAAFASLFVTAHMAADAANARDIAMTRMAQATPAQPVTWLVTANVFDAAGNQAIPDSLYFAQRTRRFDSEESCKAFVASGDADFAAATESLTAQAVAALGEGTVVRVSCTVEPTE